MNRAIRDMFDTLPGVYEFINHVITLGLDIGWRKKAARFASKAVAGEAVLPAHGGGSTREAAADSPLTDGTSVWVDVSTGTGELAANLGGLVGHETTVIATDFSLAMLRAAAGKNAGILVVCADNKALPFRSCSLGLVTISLGTRNLNTSRSALVSCFREFHRVLRPGGWFVNLETSQPDSRLIRKLFHAYARGFLRPVATAISRNRSAYSYLANTICSFYRADELADIIREAGFERVVVQRLFLGVAAIHGAEKGCMTLTYTGRQS